MTMLTSGISLKQLIPGIDQELAAALNQTSFPVFKEMFDRQQGLRVLFNFIGEELYGLSGDRHLVGVLDNRMHAAAVVTDVVDQRFFWMQHESALQKYGGIPSNRPTIVFVVFEVEQ